MLIPLNQSQFAVADVNGFARVRFYNNVAGSSWVVKRMVTNVSGAGVTSQSLINLAVYSNSESESNRRDGTSSAAQDASETDIPLQATDVLIGVYSGAPAGSICTLTISGTVETGRY